MKQKIGSLVFATEQGLGILAKSFFDNGVLTDVLVVKHHHRECKAETWYPGAKAISGKHHAPDLNAAKEFVATLDTVLFFETPFYWELIPFCRERGVKTVMMPMYECMPVKLPYQPDSFICPSLLDQRYFPDNSVFIPVPVSVTWRKREKAEVFVHNAGFGGLRSRNGTGLLLDAMKLVSSPVKLILRTQKRLQWGVDDPRIDYRIGSIEHFKLWDEGDVFIFPEKFNGLSLPLQEAYAAGMLVMATDRFPMNTWLPQESLIETRGEERTRISGRCVEFNESIIDPRDIAAMVDEWYNASIGHYSEQGKAWAIENSWEVLKPRYLEALAK